MYETTAGLAALGVADPGALSDLVAVALGVTASECHVLDIGITESPYDLEALTTESRQRVHGRARTPDGDQTFSIFVKVVRSWAHSPGFAMVPPAAQEAALALLPWESEPAVYASDLRLHLPAGLTMPHTVGVRPIDATHAAIWMEDIAAVPGRWDIETTAEAARRLGRFAASVDVLGAVRPALDVSVGRTIAGFVNGPVQMMWVPPLHSGDLWQHPLVARYFGPLRSRLLAALDTLPALVEEVESLPCGTSHGDACPRNLLRVDDHDEIVMIDFGFLSRAPLGFDLTQLVLAEALMGERPAGDVPLLHDAALPAYLSGLADEGIDADETSLRRAVAICAFLFCGPSAVPSERLGDPVSTELEALFANRAAVLSLLLDRLAA